MYVCVYIVCVYKIRYTHTHTHIYTYYILYYIHPYLPLSAVAMQSLTTLKVHSSTKAASCTTMVLLLERNTNSTNFFLQAVYSKQCWIMKASIHQHKQKSITRLGVVTLTYTQIVNLSAPV